jgi:hypothetical protein
VTNLLGFEFRIGPKMGGFSLLASRILYDIPEVIDKKCQDDPKFKICEIKEEILKWNREKSHYLAWEGRKILNISWKELDDLSKEIVFYSFKGFISEHLFALFRNTFNFLSIYRLSSGFPAVRDWKWDLPELKRHFPDDLDDFENSWQGRGRLKRGLKILEMPLSVLFWLCLIICIASIGYYWNTCKEDVIIKLSIFSIIAVIMNALCMSTLAGISGRYHTRVGFLLIFPALTLISRLINTLKKRVWYRINKDEF